MPHVFELTISSFQLPNSVPVHDFVGQKFGQGMAGMAYQGLYLGRLKVLGDSVVRVGEKNHLETSLLTFLAPKLK